MLHSNTKDPYCYLRRTMGFFQHGTGKARCGGGLYADAGAFVTLETSEIFGCKATRLGGGASVTDGAILTLMQSSAISHCTATGSAADEGLEGNGGGVYEHLLLPHPSSRHRDVA